MPPKRSITQKYYSDPKKREISGLFLWSKVLLDKRITNRLLAGLERSIGMVDLLAAVQMKLDLDSKPPDDPYNPGANMQPRCLCREVIVLGQANLHAMQSMQENDMQEGFSPDC